MGGKPRKKPGRVVWVSRDKSDQGFVKLWTEEPNLIRDDHYRGNGLGYLTSECTTEWRRTFGARCTPRPGQCIKMRLMGSREGS